MDMSGVNTTTAMIDNNPNLHPAVLSANITVTPIEVTQPRTRSELGWGGERARGGGGGGGDFSVRSSYLLLQAMGAGNSPCHFKQCNFERPNVLHPSPQAMRKI